MELTPKENSGLSFGLWLDLTQWRPIELVLEFPVSKAWPYWIRDTDWNFPFSKFLHIFGIILDFYLFSVTPVVIPQRICSPRTLVCCFSYTAFHLGSVFVKIRSQTKIHLNSIWLPPNLFLSKTLSTDKLFFSTLKEDTHTPLYLCLHSVAAFQEPLNRLQFSITRLFCSLCWSYSNQCQRDLPTLGHCAHLYKFEFLFCP